MNLLSLTTLLSNLNRYFTKVKRNITPLIYSTTTIPANGVLTYDLKNYADDFTDYHGLSVNVTVLILNNETGTPTQGYYINSSASITYGIKETGEIIVSNSDNKPYDLIVRIEFPTVKKA